jgi:hypothetical protein
VLHLLLFGVFAPAVEQDLLEVVEVRLEADLHQGLLVECAVEVVGADAFEVRGLGQFGELVDQALLRPLPVALAQLTDRAGIRIRVERVAGVLEGFEPASELVVQQASACSRRSRCGLRLQQVPGRFAERGGSPAVRVLAAHS